MESGSQNPISPWTKEDGQMLKLLDEFLSKKASWTLSTSDAVHLYRILVWVASLEKKIEQSQVEIVSVKKVKKKDE